jgi:hypothetical protein
VLIETNEGLCKESPERRSPGHPGRCQAA